MLMDFAERPACGACGRYGTTINGRCGRCLDAAMNRAELRVVRVCPPVLLIPSRVGGGRYRPG
jgi:hypothetical protein